MAETSDEKTLEMRLAALEDKLSGLHVSEEEMRAYHKVASLIHGGVAPTADAGATALTPVPQPQPCVTSCVVQQCIVHPCVVQQCTIRACTVVQQCTIRACTVVQQCTIRACTIEQCINECGGGLPGGPISGGGFGTLGG